MKFLNLTLALCLIPGLALAESKELSVDIEQSTVSWVGRKVTGQHDGTVSLKSGTVKLDGSDFVGGRFEIDMTSIKNNDVESDEWRKKLEDHLRSADFFDVTNHPTATFELSKVEKATSGNEQTVTGKLTIKGISHEISFPASIVESSGTYRAKGTAKIDRTKWNVQYNSGKFFDIQKLGDKMIYDEIEISLDLVAK